MPRIQFPDGFDGVEHLPRTNRNLQNCFNNGDGSVIGRPGIALIKDMDGVARGLFEWNGSLYAVYSEELRKITNVNTGAFTVIGAISGAEHIRTAVGFNDAVIVVPGIAIYKLDKSDVLTLISGNANFEPSVDVAHINGRFVYIPSSGDPAFFSDVGAAGTVQPLSFFDAEELPDKNNAVFNGKNTLFIGGEDSFELFRDVGTTPNPFARISGSRILNGFIGGLLEYNNTYLFIGNEKDQGAGIYAIVPSGAQKISNHRIDLILAGYTPEIMQRAISGRIKWRGYDIATFTLGSDSFGFFNGNWFILNAGVSATSNPWSAGFIAQFRGEYFSAFEENFGRFEKINTDYGERITRLLDIGFEQEDDEFFSAQNIELGISQGFNAGIGSVALQMSRDNVQFGPPVFRELGVLGKYQDKLVWNLPGGLGNYHGFMGVRFYTTADIDFTLEYLIADIRA